MPAWLRETGAALSLSVHVQPGAKRNEFAGVHGDAIKVRIAAPATDGRANAALVELVAQRLGLAKSAVALKRGQKSRCKVLALSGVSADAVLRLLGQ